MLIKIDQTPDFFNRITHTLQPGGVIALPTDTVYGFAVDATQAGAVARLKNLKGRETKPFTIFIAKGRIREYARPSKRKIIDYFVPGALTVILRHRKDIVLPNIEDRIGIRIPQTDYIIKLLSLYPNPLAVTSANRSGQPPLTTGADIARDFAECDLIIDGNIPSPKPSTVIDLTTKNPVVRRKGKIPILEIEKVYGQMVRLDNALNFNVLFVCTANTCRSPMAEGILKTMVNPDHCEVRSAGILPMDGLPAARFSADVVGEYGGSIAGHSTKTISQELIDWADLILVMEFKHYNAILNIDSRAAIKTFLLKEYKRKTKYNEVFDPVGRSIDFYRMAARDMLRSLKLIARNIEKRFDKTKG
jgi:tRNA threonylcarbamoyl adenosine modification protein (Sua5/YciO/YrdC/YwlC family)